MNLGATSKEAIMAAFHMDGDYAPGLSFPDYVIVIENILILLVREKIDCNALIEIIRKIIYQR